MLESGWMITYFVLMILALIVNYFIQGPQRFEEDN